MNQFIPCVFVTLAIVLAGCAGVPDAEPAKQPFVEAAPGLAGYETLYIYRPPERVKKYVPYEILLNGIKVVTLKDATYTVVYVRPGNYAVSTDRPFFSRSLSEDSNIPGAITIEGNGPYFLKFDRSYGPAVPGQVYTIKYERWRAAERDEAIRAMQKTTFVTPVTAQISS